MGWRLRLSRADGPSACRVVVLMNVRLAGLGIFWRHCRHALKTDSGDRRDISVLLMVIVVDVVFDAPRLSFAIADCRGRRTSANHHLLNFCGSKTSIDIDTHESTLENERTE